MSNVGVASGKVILVGEHAVVYGAPGLAMGIPRGARAVASKITDACSVLEIPGWSINVREHDKGYDLGQAFAALCARLRDAGATDVVRVVAESTLPPAAGLGCSAALGVAVARAIVPSADAHVIHHAVMAWESVFHGNPSGIDALVAARGGWVFFQRDTPATEIFPGASLTFVVGYSGTSSRTRAMVEHVACLANRAHIESVMHAIGELACEGRRAIERGDVHALGEILSRNQICLSELQLSTPAIERMCTVARSLGALGSKLTGAGGGGSVIALVKDASDAERVREGWHCEGFESFVVRRDCCEVNVGPESEASP